MDSRIREIEQWIEKAKTGLSDGGREEYVKKLFLLDAEIRAVIKENGNIPGVNYSPERRGRGARRSATSLAAVGAAASVLLLAAAAAWFANPVSQAPGPAGKGPASLAAGEVPVVPVVAPHIPASISGEEVVVADWLDLQPIELLASADPPAEQPAASEAPVLDIGPALTGGGLGGPVMPASLQGPGQPVILAVGNRDQAGNPVQFQQAAYSATAQAARNAAHHAPGGSIETAERFVSVDIVDNNNPQDPDDVDKLDPDALKRNVEKHFAK